MRGRLAAASTALSAVVLAVVLLVVAEDVPSSAEACVKTEDDRDLARAIMIGAIDEALAAHTKLVFEIWMKDPSDQPKRAIIGMRQGVSAWARSRAAASTWDPPMC